MSNISSLEKVVIRLLNESGIPFEKEYVFKDLRNGLYRFDFYLPTKNVIIEVHGPQHYEYSKMFHKKREDFKKAQERDRRKISYCLANNIPLYCIPGWEVHGLQTAEDIFQEKYLAKDKFHNDNVWREHKSRRI